MLPKIREWKGEPYRWVHYKFDGLCLRVVCTSEGIECWTRRPTNLANALGYSHLMRLFETLPVGFKVYGELYAPGLPASAVKSLIAHKDDGIQFAAFALPNVDHHADLSQISDICLEAGLLFAPWSIQTNNLDPATRFALLKQAGGWKDLEGFVLKQYAFGQWYKWKPVRTVECVVTGWIDGQGKYLGLIGSLEVSLFFPDGRLCIVANVSGFDDLTRTLDPESLTGKVIEVAYQYVGSRGRLRHPRFVRFRDDKRGVDCLSAQLD